MTWSHRDRAIAAGNAAAIRWEELPVEARGRQSDGDLLAMSLHAERGRMVLDDLAGLPAEPATIVEGTVLPASAVVSTLVPRDRVLWLLPTAEFQARALAAQGTTPTRLVELLTARIAAEAAGLPTLAIGASDATVEDVVVAVERRVASALRAGPHARDQDERRDLLRDANRALVEQVRAGARRAWGIASAEDVRRRFACECGDPSCVAELELAVAEAAASPVRAHPV